MLPTPPPPDRLRRYVLGDLTPEEAAEVASWIESNPDASGASRDLASGESAVDTSSSDLRSATPEVLPPGDTPAASLFTTPCQAEFGACGVRIGGFRIVRQLGEGGMGVVYEAIEEALGRKAAVKVLRAQLLDKNDCHKRFLREGRAAAAIKSDHVVTIYQVGEASGLPYIAMEFLEGTNLEDWILARGGPASVSDVLWVARDLLTGLAAAHAEGILHRDIKPSNLWVDSRTGRVKVLDFGLTRGAHGDDTLTKPGAVMGKPAYMAPEQARGAKLDSRADLFSVGVVLYRMLAGRSPFARSNIPGTLLAVATEEAPPLPGIPPALSGFIDRLLAKNADDRPSSASVALAELVALGKAPGAPTVRGRSRGWMVAVGFAVAAVLVLGVIFIIRDRNGKEIARVEVPGEVAKGGTVEVVEPTTGNRSMLSIPSGGPVPTFPPAKDPPQPSIASPKEEAPRPRQVKEAQPPVATKAPSMRARVKSEITGVTMLEGGEGRFVPVGSTGTIMANEPKRELYQIQFDDPMLGTLWLPIRVTEPLKAGP